MRFFRRAFLLGICFFTNHLFGEISYKVEYVGIENKTVLKTIKASSQLTTLQKKHPESMNALKYRAESDIPEMLKILQAHGYYEASIQVQIEEKQPQALVLVYIHPGPAYNLEAFSLSLFQGTKERCITCPSLDSKKLDLKIGSPLIAQEVINAELKALEILSLCGYPTAFIVNRSIVLNGDTKTASVLLEIDSGPLLSFGSVEFKGNKKVKSRYIQERIAWEKEEIYSSQKIEETQKELMDSGLFSSVLITHQETPSPDGMLPIQIDVAESKHRSIYGGVSYQTYYGPGLTFGWEHRNLNGMGRKFSLQGDVTRRSHVGVATYSVPNFYKIGQDYVWEAQATHLDIFPYTERSYTLTNRFEKKINKGCRTSFGIEGERLFMTSSVLDGEYWLLEVPIFFAYNGANSLLNPTQGFNFEYKATPSISVSSRKKAYIINQFSLSHYVPLTPRESIVFAEQLSVGFFFSGHTRTIPVGKRFFGGSEEELRGYTYYSVSPLTSTNKPIGGRAAIYYTAEARLRFTNNFGLVPFFDMGNVSDAKFPTWNGQWLKSLGLGVRYFSFIGPFRLDIGFPLDKRKGIDKNYRVLLSIGQTF